ncbi:hypothetical protein Pmani_039755 [Petrolisthes manimaculis]|uniref:Uncharacterized protein n=1 Tax=Petrolisthes manimaculis TaxID=1843537 RepID=A0AAE1TJ99_9EUCA|nr:hypothetical protein Pmani_039755 [Petrolisthes manimaculis]
MTTPSTSSHLTSSLPYLPLPPLPHPHHLHPHHLPPPPITTCPFPHVLSHDTSTTIALRSLKACENSCRWCKVRLLHPPRPSETQEPLTLLTDARPPSPFFVSQPPSTFPPFSPYSFHSFLVLSTPLPFVSRSLSTPSIRFSFSRPAFYSFLVHSPPLSSLSTPSTRSSFSLHSIHSFSVLSPPLPFVSRSLSTISTLPSSSLDLLHSFPLSALSRPTLPVPSLFLLPPPSSSPPPPPPHLTHPSPE